ncbi:hypothetical protein N7499_000566 [Penicillium canescens]|uniref:Apple domain-containing protein n=1 Tax=Penicillium canescens TaxID=5083 RepID=A0AAD6IHN5_PENCN|nr:uncharacterized protein N7446_011232 [Penicillium canescens]KAJ6004498.1 hypothetical protein N7522_006143 [Penicillium canescens]KAJ6029418.1 hypothetical protein N7444_012405 [Penicillium canescens]KAJ6047849.1 hypothetical protein N7460_003996 [Penicillium canescens]KAJ6048549.1 hypothetical protein N7446_011232 [Penicillium canescens]KAJ6100936.1 hypothetical protein N7499_000566 [Penicillium canescens]
MNYLIAIVLTSLVSGALAAGPGLSTDQSYCPSCVGNRYTDITTGQSGCCPIGTVYQPAACAPGTPTTDNPTCPADNGKNYIKNGFTYKVYCDVTTNLNPDVGSATLPDAKACADLCASRPACGDATYRSSDKGCFMSSNLLGPNYQGTPLAGAIVLAKQ